MKYPPYLAYLAFFVLAGGLRGDFAHHAYYPRLRKLLGEPVRAGTYPGFDKMHCLWEDLENWSQRDMSGSLGVFEIRLASRLVHVGIPFSQAILSEQERQLLPRIFADSSLAPGSAPSDSFLSYSLLKFGSNRLRRGTLRILENGNRGAVEYQFLIDAVQQQLSNWDGTAAKDTDEAQKTAVLGAVRIWCDHIDPISERARFRLLLRTKHEFPDEPLLLKVSGCPDFYECSEYRSGWSTPICALDGLEIDAAAFDWTGGVRFNEVNLGWRFGLGSGTVRLLATGAPEGLHGLVEVQQLPKDSPFYVLASWESQKLIEQWGTTECSGFAKVPIRRGLPPDWSLYSVQRAVDVQKVRDVFPILSFPSATRISFRGGVRLSGNTFFRFALPQVVVEGAPEKSIVLCNGKRFGLSAESPLILPGETLTDEKLVIEVSFGETVLSRQAIYAISELDWPQSECLAFSDVNGRRTASLEESLVCGALVPRKSDGFTAWIEDGNLECTDELFIRQTDQLTTVMSSPAEPVQPPETGSRPLTTRSDTVQAYGALLDEWRNEILSGTSSGFVSRLARSQNGPELTEGCLQYLSGCQTSAHRSWNRAIKELSVAGTSPDPLVGTVARALLQLAFYRSGRIEKCKQCCDEIFPQGFNKLRTFMTALAGPTTGGETDGIGVERISPYLQDSALQEQVLAALNQEDTGTETTVIQ